MIIASIIAASLAHAGCFEILQRQIDEICLSEPEMLEHRAGITQVYVCEQSAGVPDVVAIFTLDAELADPWELEPQSCAEGTLLLSGDTSRSLLDVWSSYMDRIHI